MAEPARPSVRTVSSATCVCLFRADGRPESTDVELSTELLAYMSDLVAGLAARGEQAAEIEFQGWVGEVVWVEGGLGDGYMAWLHRERIAAGASAVKELSDRQLQIARRAADGESAVEIAGQLGISPHTVRDHMKQIYRRLEIASRLELAEIMHSLDRANAL